MIDTTFVINHQNDVLTPVLLSIPHCGQRFPHDFMEISSLNHDALLVTADIGTERLFEVGLPLQSIEARFGRSFVDLNRARTQLDPAVVDDIFTANDPQIRSGYGVIPRFATHGQLTHVRKLTRLEAETRLQAYYDPYHHALQNMINQHLAKFRVILLLDIHSAPSEFMQDKDVMVGTNFGTSCTSRTRQAALHAFELAELSVQIGGRFEGGFITQAYGLKKNVEVLQIEVNRKLIVNDSNQLDLIQLEKLLPKWKIAINALIEEFLAINMD